MTDKEFEEQVVEYLNDKAETFAKLCNERHEAGAQEYGELTFLENDIVRMMLEELADVTNYCRMHAIKLLVLQDQLESKLQKDDDLIQGGDIQMGFKSFKGTKDVGWR